jgi:hypothetical protein
MVSSLHSISEGRPIRILGVTSASLADYLTSEKDVARNLSRMPGDEFLITNKPSEGEDDFEMPEDDEWVLIDHNG